MFNVLSIVFLAAGVNVVTSELVESQVDAFKSFIGLMVCLLGIAFFVFESSAARCQQNAKEYQRKEKKGILASLIDAEAAQLPRAEKACFTKIPS